MRKQGTLLSVLLLLGTLPLFSQTKEQAKPSAQPSGQQQVTQTIPPPQQSNAQVGPIRIPPEAAKKVNPVKPTASSIAAGKQRFSYDCAMCHNANGDGKGDLAESMKLKLPDLRDPAALKAVTDGGLYYVISKGLNPMPAEESRAKPDEIWNLVNYVRSLAETKVSQKSK